MSSIGTDWLKFIGFMNPCESPLEVVFLVWWEATIRSAGDITPLYNAVSQYEVRVDQATYRLDFAIGYHDRYFMRWHDRRHGAARIAVELDGHEFHERTREQVEDRNRRDRTLASNGWEVLHFAGRELLRDPERVVLEVLRRAADIFDESYRTYCTWLDNVIVGSKA